MESIPPAPAAVSSPSYQLPVQPPKPGHRGLIITIIVIAIFLLVLIAGAVAAAFYYPPAIALRSALTLPHELKGAVFLADGPAGTTAYTLSGFSYKPQALNGILLSGTDHLATSVVRTGESYVLTLNGKSLPATSTPRVGVSALTDGSMAVYATTPTTTPQLLSAAPNLYQVLTLDATQWHIELVQLRPTTIMTQRGPSGMAPLFLDGTHIVYLSPAGIFVWNPASGTVTELLHRTFRNIAVSMLQSPDHSLIAYRDLSAKNVTIYRVTATSAEAVATIAAEKSVSSYALGNDALYALHTTPNGTEIWKQGFADKEPHRIGFLPQSLQITRLLIGSL